MKALRDATEIPTEALEPEVRAQSRPVLGWAVAGGVILVVQLYVWAKWITGPYFVRVPPGPS